MQPQTTLGPGAAVSQMAGVTLTTMVLIGVGVILALLLIWWGARKKRERRAAERELVDNGAVRDGDAPIDDAEALSAPERARRVDMGAPIAAVQPEPIAAPPVVLTPAPFATDAASRDEALPLTPVADEPAASTPGASDDLTQMKGIGPKLAARLNELGINRYADIAKLDSVSAVALDAQLGSFTGRLTRDRWIEQARFLAAGDRAGFEAAFGRL